LEHNLSIVDIISIISSLSALILAIVSIWLSLYHKKSADAIYRETQNLLIEIKTDSKTISQIAMPELRAYGESIRNYVFNTLNGDDHSSNGQIVEIHRHLAL